jgi:hypothetical protein
VPRTYEIHPSIGISRVGTSEEFFLGPEPDVPPPAKYRDRSGKLLRQGARFRIFACERDDSGRLVEATEVDAAATQVEWTVHVANRKGEAEVSPPSPSRRTQGGKRRNAGHTNRADLVIDPGPRTLRGAGQRATFDGGRFLGRPVPLGEAQTDAQGRLIVLGGFGRSDGPPQDLVTFANNDNWHDDVSDGPVRASFRPPRSRRRVEAQPAWVIVAPPDFAPQIVNFVTLYDVAFQVAVERGWRTVPEKPSFRQHILPILSRAVGYSWVIELARVAHAPGGFGDFLAETRIRDLANPKSRKFVRQVVFERLRDPNHLEIPSNIGSMPRLHDETNSENVLPPTKAQYQALQSWVAGNFVNDLNERPPPEPLPDGLDRMALEACTGGPFFPGIEAGRIMREAQRYLGPFRLDPAQLGPGRVTEGNAVPWQADFLLCRFGDRTELGWWPAQRPDKVLVDVASEDLKRWARRVESFADMVEHWHELGVVVPRQAPDGTRVFVESERLLPER